MEYPGRYSRWHLAYVNPCAEIVARGRVITVRALNARGAVLLPVLGAALAAGRRSPRPAARVGEVERADPRARRAGRGGGPQQAADGVLRGARGRSPRSWRATTPHLGLYGAFGYDLAFQFEPVTRGSTGPAASATWSCTCPTSCSWWTASARRRCATPTSSPWTACPPQGLPTGHAGACGGPGRRTGSVRHERRPEPGSYARIVEQAKERFARGDLFEVVPSQAFRAPCVSAGAFYQLLRKRNPAPYEFFFNLGEGECLVGASPEMYVRVTGDRVETCPISGTIAARHRPAGGRGEHPARCSTRPRRSPS